MGIVNMDLRTSKQTLLQVVSTCTAAAFLRYFLMTSKYQKVIANHIEVSTPLNSWKRVLEGLFLQSKGINPYGGDLLHETALSLTIYRTLVETYREKIVFVFILIDTVTGLVLYYVALQYQKQLYNDEKEKEKTYAKGVEKYFLKASVVRKASFYVLAAFLFNPFTVLNCVGYATTTFHNFLLSLSLFCMVCGIPLSGFFLALCSSISFYPITLLIPMSLYFLNVFHSISKTVGHLVTFLTTSLLILYYNSNYGKDFGFISNVYGFILNVHDLQPNVGLFWYFFTEMFDHFRELFIWAFQINATVLYLIPLSVRFRKQPFLLTVSVLLITTIFKSYPCIGDVGFVISLLPCFLHLVTFSQQSFIIGIILLISTSLAPVLWHLWIYCNSANANFYFGVTLAFAISQIFLLTDLLFAFVKREYIMVHGQKKTINGEKAILCLE